MTHITYFKLSNYQQARCITFLLELKKAANWLPLYYFNFLFLRTRIFSASTPKEKAIAKYK